MSTMTDISNSTAAWNDYQKVAAGTDDYLGRLIILTVHQGLADRQGFNDALTAAGLDKKHHVKRSAETDVFRKVTSSINNQTVDLTSGDRARLLLVPIANSGDRLVRRIVVEVLNSNDERLSYTECCDVVFDRDTSVITVEHLATMWTAPTEAREAALDVAGTVDGEFRYRRQMLDADGLRSAVVKVLRSLLCVTVKESGGVYFVPESPASTVEALSDATDGFPTVRFHVVPLLEDPKQRALVTEAIEDEITAACDALLAEATKEADAGSLSARRRASILSRQAEMVSKLEDYKGRLGDDLSKASTRLRLVQMQMAAFA